MDFTIERKEKVIESRGMEGKQAILPSESSMQEAERGWSQGSLRVPLMRSHSRRISWSGDSRQPIMDFS